MNNRSVLQPFQSQQNNDRYILLNYRTSMCVRAVDDVFVTEKSPSNKNTNNEENEINERATHTHTEQWRDTL